MAKVRAGTARGRATKGSKGKSARAFSSVHNDRNYNKEKANINQSAENINDDLTVNNVNWNWISGYNSGITFDQAEQTFYQQHFEAKLEKTNQNYIKNRHPERVKTMEDWRANAQKAPEEVIYTLGNADEGYADAETLLETVKDFLKWQEERYPQLKVLDWSLHLDEPKAAPHVHVRQVYVAIDKDGLEEPNQSLSLKQMGVKPSGTIPKDKETGEVIRDKDGEIKTGQHYNAKITLTNESHEMFQKIAEEHGTEIEYKVREHGKQGRKIEEFKAQKAQELAKKAEEEKKKAEELRRQEQNKAAHFSLVAAEEEPKAEEAKAQKEEYEKEASDAKEQAEQAKETAIQQQEEALRIWIEVQSAKQELSQLNREIKEKQTLLKRITEKIDEKMQAFRQEVRNFLGFKGAVHDMWQRAVSSAMAFREQFQGKTQKELLDRQVEKEVEQIIEEAEMEDYDYDEH